MNVTLWNIQEALAQGTVHFEHKTLKNSDGTRLRARSNGALKTWVRRPDQFRIPCKYGLKECFYITDFDADNWEIV